MAPPQTPYQPYASRHAQPNGPGDARPTALEIVKDCEAIGKLQGRTILITGCSSGIGKETARALYETGAKLFLTARDMPKLEAAIEDIVATSDVKDTPRPTAIEMRLESLESVKQGVETFKRLSGGTLNVLINNAGVMATPYSQTQEGFESQIGICHMAHFYLFQLLKPLLLQSAKESNSITRVINLSSAAHRAAGVDFNNLNAPESAYNKWVAYAQAKTANIYMTSAITRYYGDEGITGLAVHPGAVESEIFRHMAPEDYAAFDDLAAMEKTIKSTKQGAATSVWAAVSPHFENISNGGKLLGDVGEARAVQDGDAFDSASYAPHAYDEKAEDRLWKVSCEAVGVPLDI